jgi:hypothetical protein
VVGQVNDQSAVMLVDTGADSTMLTMPGVSRLKLDARGDVAGRSLLRFARVESLSIGGIKGVRQDMPVIGQIQFGEAIDAMVGANFLFQADVEFNLSKPEISFFQPIGCDTAFLAYWGGDAFFVEATRASGTDRRPMFKVQVNVDAIIDSGANSSVIDTQAAAAVGVTLDSPGVTRAGMSGGIGDKLVQNYL